MLGLLLTPLSVMSISPGRNSMNSSKATSSTFDLDVRKDFKGFPIRKSRFLERKRYRATVLIQRPLDPFVYQLGEPTGRFLPRDGRTGL